MSRLAFPVFAAWSIASVALAAEPSKPLVTGLQNPTAVAVGPDGRVYVAVMGEPDKAGALLRFAALLGLIVLKAMLTKLPIASRSAELM